MGTIAAPVERVVAFLAEQLPTFLWAPTSPETLLLDRARGLIGTRKGACNLGPGGLDGVGANSSTEWIEFAANAGLDMIGPPAGGIAVMAVTITDPSAVTGCFLKIGDATGGLGFGAGDTTFEDVGSRMIILREGTAWHPHATGGDFVAGLNIFVGAQTSEGAFVMENVTAGTSLQIGAIGGLNPTSNIYINGYYANRGSNAQVNLAATWPLHVTNADFVLFYNKVLSGLLTLDKAPNRGAVQRLFRPIHRPQQFVSATVQLLRPTSDISAGAWTPSTGVDLYATVDEAAADDADYNTTSSASTHELAFSFGVDPESSSGHTVRYRAKGIGTLTVTLRQGATLIATHVPTLTGSYQTFSFTLSGAEADAITNYGDLRVRFVSS